MLKYLKWALLNWFVRAVLLRPPMCSGSKMTFHIQFPPSQQRPIKHAMISLGSKAGFYFVHRSNKATTQGKLIGMKSPQFLKNQISISFNSRLKLKIGNIRRFVGAFVK